MADNSHPDIYYEPGKTSHGLPHDPFKSIVIPRPIGWISTTNSEGQDNLAPFSQFTNVAFDPPTILFVGHGSAYKDRSKDTVVNARQTGEFVWNLATYDLRNAVNASSLETWDDEFPIAHVTKAPSRLVRPPRVAESPIQYECKTWSIIQVPGNSRVGCSDIVIGRVVAVHIKGNIITGNGLIDVLKTRPLARLGYHQYSSVQSIFEMHMPIMPDDPVGQAILGGDAAQLKDLTAAAAQAQSWKGTAFVYPEEFVEEDDLALTHHISLA